MWHQRNCHQDRSQRVFRTVRILFIHYGRCCSKIRYNSCRQHRRRCSIRMRGVVSAMSDATLDRWFRLVSRHDGSPPRRDNESPWISLSHCINPLARWLIPPTWECGFHLRPGHTTDRTTSPTTPLIAPPPTTNPHTLAATACRSVTVLDF